jgi:ligand-binding sensor domain-containing protein
MKWRNLFFFLCFACLTTQVEAQKVPLRFESLPESAGLVNGTVSCMLQDKQGYLWMGTWTGLARFDGRSTRFFQQEPGNSIALQSDQIKALAQDQQGRIWVGTLSAGLYIFDHFTEQFTPYLPDHPIWKTDIWTILIAKNGDIWVSGKHGLYCIDPITLIAREQVINTPCGTRNFPNYLYALCQTTDGSIWVGTSCGIIRLLPSSTDIAIRHYRINPALPVKTAPDEYISCLEPDREHPDLLWVGGNTGLRCIRFGSFEQEQFETVEYLRKGSGTQQISSDLITDVLHDCAGRFWIATRNGLNTRLNKNSPIEQYFAHFSESYALNNNVVVSLLEDKNNVIWIANERGINTFNYRKSAFSAKYIQPLKSSVEEPAVPQFLANSSLESGYWVGTDRGITYCEGRAQRSFEIATPQLNAFANYTSAIKSDRDGWLWVGTLGAGLLRFRERDLQQAGTIRPERQFCEPNKGPNHAAANYIISTHDNQKDRLWVGYWDAGIEYFDRTTQQLHPAKLEANFSLNNFPNAALLESMQPNGEIHVWIGTRGNGLIQTRFEPSTGQLHLLRHWRSDVAPHQLKDNRVNDLLQDQQGHIWVATCQGLQRLNPISGEFQSVPPKSGPFGQVIQALVADENGEIWASTQQGIFKVKRGAARPEIERFFDRTDGLSDNYFNNTCALLRPDGQLIFGGLVGLSAIQVEHIEQDTMRPTTVLTRFSLFGANVKVGQMIDGKTILQQPLAATRHLTLPYSQNVITFEFAGLNTSEPFKTRFAYQLEGFDADWRYTDATLPAAHYTDLPWKSYRFLVKTANADGVWGEPTIISLTVCAPWWRTIWAYLAYALVLLGLLALGLREMHYRAELSKNLTIERIEREKAEELTRMKLEFALNEMDQQFLSDVTRIVERHMDDSEFSMDTLAHELALSRTQLYRKIESITGETPKNLVRAIRLKRAAQMLITKRLQVSEVAFQVGFTDLKNFRARFKEHFGMTPTEYQENHTKYAKNRP